jgi:hypothetical protein
MQVKCGMVINHKTLHETFFCEVNIINMATERYFDVISDSFQRVQIMH